MIFFLRTKGFVLICFFSVIVVFFEKYVVLRKMFAFVKGFSVLCFKCSILLLNFVLTVWYC